MRLAISVMLLASLTFLTACPQQQGQETSEVQTISETKTVKYEDVSDIFSNSCMPCHNHEFLPQVIQRLEDKKDVKEVDGETRERILAELYGLKARMDDGEPISFVSEKEVMKFLKSTPGEMYLMLEKGVMPASFAEDLMRVTEWPKYKTITPEERMRLLLFTKPYSKDYMR